MQGKPCLTWRGVDLERKICTLNLTSQDSHKHLEQEALAPQACVRRAKKANLLIKT